MKIIFYFCLLLCPLLIRAQDYHVSLIPDSLLRDADAVLRSEELHVIIKNTGKAIINRKFAFTILNENGEEFAYYYNQYDKFHSISDISGRMLDKEGKLLKSIKKRDIADVAVNDGESMVTDARSKRFAFYNKIYPYTVEFEDEVTYDGTFDLPEWLPVMAEKLSVQKSLFIVETPSDYQLRYKAFNYTGKPVISGNGKTQIYTWTLSNQKAILEEPLQPIWHEVTPAVFIAPTEFELGGYKGTMSTWNDFGKFIYQLYTGRDALPENVKQDVHRLTGGLSSREEKVRALYAYMQSNTRYVGIQLGIGGWQPFEAKYVAEKKYGDCKALSNYMVSLLKEAGIEAKWVLIRAGEGDKGLMEDFPSNQFSHVIACVPGPSDTLWLECTDQTVSPGYMGNFTGNRKALLITEKGGVVVKTPNYSTKDNVAIRKVDAVIDENGNLQLDAHTQFSGIQQDLQHELLNASKEKRDKFLNASISLPTYTVNKNEYNETRGKIPVVKEYLQISAPNYASVSGKRMFILPNLFNRSEKLPNDRPRQFDIEIKYAYKDIDTLVFRIPPGYIPEAMPKDISVSNKFGNYSMRYTVKDNTISLTRIHEHYASTYPASDYNELVKFFDTMYRSDRTRIVLLKKE